MKYGKMMIGIALVGCFLIGCGKGHSESSAPLLIFQEKEPYDPATDIDPIDGYDMPQDTELPMIPMDRQYDWNAQVLSEKEQKYGLVPVGDTLFQIKSAIITREVGNHDRDKIDADAGIEYDTEGNLSEESNQAILFLTMEVINVEGFMIEESVDFLPFLLDCEGVGNYTGYPLYLNPWAEGRRECERYFYRLQPGEKRTYEVGILLDTKEVAAAVEQGQKLYYVIGHGWGKAPYDIGLCIQKFWDEFCEREGL